MWTILSAGAAIFAILGSLAFCLLPRVGVEPQHRKFGGAMVDPHADKFGKRHDPNLPSWLQSPKQKRIKGPPKRNQINDRKGSGSTGRNLPVIRK